MRLGQNWLQRVCCTKNFSAISLAPSRLPLSFALCILISKLLSNLKRCDTNWKWGTFSSKAENVPYCHIQHISEGATFTVKAKGLWFHFHILATTCQCLQPSCHLPCNLLVNKIIAHDSVNPETICQTEYILFYSNLVDASFSVTSLQAGVNGYVAITFTYVSNHLQLMMEYNLSSPCV